MAEVVLHTYDVANIGSEKTNKAIIKVNRFFKDGIGLGGIFHSAIQVYGKDEWSYGFCERGWVNQFAHADKTALEVAGRTAMRIKQAKSELVSASKTAYRFFTNVTSNVKSGSNSFPQRLGNLSNVKKGNLRMQGTWSKGKFNTAKPSTSMKIDNKR